MNVLFRRTDELALSLMSDLDPILSKMIFQNVLRWTPLMIGAAVAMFGAAMVLTRQLVPGAFLLLVGIGLLILPFLPKFKEALEVE